MRHSDQATSVSGSKCRVRNFSTEKVTLKRLLVYSFTSVPLGYVASVSGESGTLLGILQNSAFSVRWCL